MIFIWFMVFLASLRIGELILAGRNERWLLEHGAVEHGKEHYPAIVAMHTAFIVSLLVEYTFQNQHATEPLLLALYLALLALKACVILTLGHFWTTKIYRIANAPLVKAGPYRYIKHPNYVIVIAEIALIPLAFHLWCTAVVFTVLNGLMLTVRIRTENRALLL